MGLTPIQTDLIRNVPKDKIEKIIEAQPENREFKLEDVWEFVIRFINSEEKYEWKRQLSWWFLIYRLTKPLS